MYVVLVTIETGPIQVLATVGVCSGHLGCIN